MRKILTLLVASFFSLAAWAVNPVNVNTANAEEIADGLKGVGMSKAEAIVAYRETNGKFIHVDELVNVKGIGIRTIDLNRGMILLQEGQVPAKD